MNHPVWPNAAITSMMRHGDLIVRLVVREFTAKYRGSVLGILWAVLTPLIMATVFVFVFGVVFRAKWGAESEPKATFTVIFLLGMIVHGIFSEAISRAPSTILGNPSYVKKVVFPLEILPVVVVLNALITAAIGILIVVILHVLLSGALSPTVVYLPLIILPFALAVLGLVYFLSSFGVYFRDMGQIIGLVTMASLFMSPIFYPLAAVPEPYRHFLVLNPVTFAVEQARAVALYGEQPDLTGLAIYTVAGALIAWLGFVLFQKTRNGFADVL